MRPSELSKSMLKVGLTGSIAVGKSYVCGILAEQGCHVLDADQTSRKEVEPGSVGLSRLIDAFGDSILNADGSLDRSALGAIVFEDDDKRQLLNSILHPLIIRSQDQWLQSVEESDPDGIAVIDAALMIESGSYRRFDEIIVVWCEPEIQLSRLIERDSISRGVALKRIGAQMTQEEKKKHATFLINTSDGFEETRLQTLAVLEKLKERKVRK